MPTLILLGLAGLGGYFLIKSLKREMAKVKGDGDQKTSQEALDDIPTLQYDEKTKKYKPIEK